MATDIVWTQQSADRLGHPRHLRKPLRERLEIKPGAADDDRQSALVTQFSENSAHVLHITADGIIDRAVHMAKEQMRRACQFRGPRPRRQNGEVAIDLHRISIDKRAAETLGEAERKVRLAARRRACNEKCGNPVVGHTIFL